MPETRSAANPEVRGAGLIRLRRCLHCLARHAADPPPDKHEQKAEADDKDELLGHCDESLGAGCLYRRVTSLRNAIPAVKGASTSWLERNPGPVVNPVQQQGATAPRSAAPAMPSARSRNAERATKPPRPPNRGKHGHRHDRSLQRKGLHGSADRLDSAPRFPRTQPLDASTRLHKITV